MTGLLTPENIIHVQNVITLLVVETIILDPFARLRENTPRVSRRLVVESGVTNPIRRRKMRCQGLEGLCVH